MADKIKTLRHTVDIAPSSVFWVLIVFLGMKFLAEITSVLLLVYIAFLIAIAINPLITWLESKKIPRSLSSVLVILSLFTAIGFLVSSFIKPLISQTQNFLTRLPEIIEKASSYNINLDSFSSQAFIVSDHVIKIAVGTLSGIITTFTTLVISYYILQARPKLKNSLITIFGHKSKLYYHIFTKLEKKLGSWVRGILTLMLSVGVFSYLGYSLIGLPYAVALGVIAGMLEIIPNIGPTITAIFAIIVGISVSPTHGLAALIVSILVQQLENNLLVPKIMQKTTGLHPLITIVALLIGFSLGGPTLAVISLPITLSLQVIITHIHLNRKNHLPQVD
ncbi:AI-2E family transporter [Patescibacteria group bacterium]|nr:AI-2E family transporter [Patescibacteria group bacterium]MBU1256776.1 AI-2E family transporter [Patescibacteria group bacterium]MBU1457387.1 AI-2E family transporter [Patescibacteria group bacterium]